MSKSADMMRTASARSQTSRVVNYPYDSLARTTQRRVAWPQILANPQWKWLENVGEFGVYASEDNGEGARTFRVLATGVVQGSVHEIAALLSASKQDEYFHKMSALHDQEFKRGTHISSVRNGGAEETPTASGKGIKNAAMAIRSATFAGPNWLHRDEEWCYLDATTFEDGVFQKWMTSLKIQDILTGSDLRLARLGSGKSLQDAVCAYRVIPEDPTNASVERDGKSPRGAFARVEFYAEYAPPAYYTTRAFGRFGGASNKQDATLKLAQQRLLSIARNCDRLSMLVRRRRLGVQVLMDKRRVLSLSNRKCIGCSKSQRLAKLCRVCGNAVCNDCSQKYERECYRPHTAIVRLETVRVCDPCMVRIESGDYSNVNDRSLLGPTVFPDAKTDELGGSRVAGKKLKTLLHDALLTAASSQRKDALISVIRCLLDQEAPTRPRFLSTLSTATSTTSTEQDDLIAAVDRLTLPSVSSEEASIAGQQGRSYTLDPNDPEAYPVPHNEVERLQAINDSGMLEKATNWAELDIICDLAAKEVGAFASIVSVITEDEQRVVAANNPGFKALRSTRADAFCSHTIMENRPLIVPHPEADFRLSHVARKWNMGVRFYCGFPIKSADDTVIGTLCCVDQQTHELTESQYSAMERLAQTATKIIRVEAAKKRHPTVPEEHQG